MKCSITRFLACITIVLNIWLSSAHGESEVDQLIVRGGYIIKNGDITLQLNQHQLFTPASTIKILTSLVALETLGPDYRFSTHFYYDSDNNLYIKGFGDPYLTSEAVLKICKELASRKITDINEIFLDDSSFSLINENSTMVSANPYDAPSGALAVNFNALPIKVAVDGSISSGEPQTPYIPLMGDIGQHLAEGNHRVNISIAQLQEQGPPPLTYVGELFAAQFGKVGISVKLGFSTGVVPAGLQPSYIYESSTTLKEIVRGCLKYSNNFIANQLFLYSGAAAFGFPATWKKSRHHVAKYLHTLFGDDASTIIIREGSGLSRDNRISPAALFTILQRFQRYSELLNHHEKLFIKSGTLSNVFCYAGYYREHSGLIPFVIMLNQQKNNRDLLLQQLLVNMNKQAIPEPAGLHY